MIFIFSFLITAVFAHTPESFESFSRVFNENATDLISSNQWSSYDNQVWFCSRVSALNQDEGESWGKPRPWYRFKSLSSDNQEMENTGLNPILLFVKLDQYQAHAGTADRQEVEYLRWLNEPTEGDALVSEVTIGTKHPLYSKLESFSRANPNRKVLAYIHCPLNQIKAHSILLNMRDLYNEGGIIGALRGANGSPEGLGPCRYRRHDQRLKKDLATIYTRSGIKILQDYRYRKVDEFIFIEGKESKMSFFNTDGTTIQTSTLTASIPKNSKDWYLTIYESQMIPPKESPQVTADQRIAFEQMKKWVLTGKCGD